MSGKGVIPAWGQQFYSPAGILQYLAMLAMLAYEVATGQCCFEADDVPETAIS
jgi:hypothetical protein